MRKDGAFPNAVRAALKTGVPCMAPSNRSLVLLNILDTDNVTKNTTWQNLYKWKRPHLINNTTTASLAVRDATNEDAKKKIKGMINAAEKTQQVFMKNNIVTSAILKSGAKASAIQRAEVALSAKLDAGSDVSFTANGYVQKKSISRSEVNEMLKTHEICLDSEDYAIITTVYYLEETFEFTVASSTAKEFHAKVAIPIPDQVGNVGANVDWIATENVSGGCRVVPTDGQEWVIAIEYMKLKTENGVAVAKKRIRSR